MPWIMMLTLLATAMLAIESIGAERRFSRSVDPHEPREWEQALFEQLKLHEQR
ncbi:MAG TPA: hypothetical protein VGB70_11415 [Allosphingosinicella sp.]|jgi:hypothetical protein